MYCLDHIGSILKRVLSILNETIRARRVCSRSLNFTYRYGMHLCTKHNISCCTLLSTRHIGGVLFYVRVIMDGYESVFVCISLLNEHFFPEHTVNSQNFFLLQSGYCVIDLFFFMNRRGFFFHFYRKKLNLIRTPTIE